MNVLLILAHPEPDSFNAALARTAAATLRGTGHDVRTSELYQMHFNPISDRLNFTSVKDPTYLKLQQEELHATAVGGFAPDLEEEMQKLEWCDLMIWQFPLWWFGLPAILKGWADRVLAMGRAYGAGRKYETGVFKGRRALLSLTTGAPAEKYLPDGFDGDMLAILRPIHRGILQFVGFEVLAPQICYAPVRQSPEERTAALAAWAHRLRDIERERAFEVGRY